MEVLSSVLLNAIYDSNVLLIYILTQSINEYFFLKNLAFFLKEFTEKRFIFKFKLKFCLLKHLFHIHAIQTFF